MEIIWICSERNLKGKRHASQSPSRNQHQACSSELSNTCFSPVVRCGSRVHFSSLHFLPISDSLFNQRGAVNFVNSPL